MFLNIAMDDSLMVVGRANYLILVCPLLASVVMCRVRAG